MEDFDTTTPEETETERLNAALAAIWEALDGLNERLEALNVQVADLHHTRRVGRQQATDQDPEWF